MSNSDLKSLILTAIILCTFQVICISATPIASPGGYEHDSYDYHHHKHHHYDEIDKVIIVKLPNKHHHHYDNDNGHYHGYNNGYNYQYGYQNGQFSSGYY